MEIIEVTLKSIVYGGCFNKTYLFFHTYGDKYISMPVPAIRKIKEEVKEIVLGRSHGSYL